MPTYDYRCESCGHVWEVRLNQGDTPPQSCPRCGSKELQRLFPAPHVAKGGSRPAGQTCCGREERCATPPVRHRRWLPEKLTAGAPPLACVADDLWRGFAK
ncbi:FmdB family zinc ribbon protein [Thermodesulfitimonas sp.]